MELTEEFKNIVCSSRVDKKNLLRLRIMLKDSLLVDQSFDQFSAMCQYAKKMGVNFWMEKSEELEKAPEREWNKNLMNLELVKLVTDFTQERVRYCQSIIKKVYGITCDSVKSTSQGKGSETDEDYKLKEKLNGNFSCQYDDIETLQRAAEALQRAAGELSRVCKNIIRKGRNNSWH